MILIPVVAVEDTLVTVLPVLSVGVDAVVGDTVVNVVGVLVVSVKDREAHTVLYCNVVVSQLHRKRLRYRTHYLRKPATTRAAVKSTI